jgi:hypothetical protein
MKPWMIRHLSLVDRVHSRQVSLQVISICHRTLVQLDVHRCGVSFLKSLIGLPSLTTTSSPSIHSKYPLNNLQRLRFLLSTFNDSDDRTQASDAAAIPLFIHLCSTLSASSLNTIHIGNSYVRRAICKYRFVPPLSPRFKID